MSSKISEHFDVREFVPKEVYDIYKENSKQFVSRDIIRIAEYCWFFFNEQFKADDVEKVSIMINNWHYGGTFNNRGLRTFDYIKSQLDKGVKTAKLSQHIGGSTNAIDLNVVVYYKNGTSKVIDSDIIYDLIIKNEMLFMGSGLTTVENKAMTKGWTHLDCRFTGLKTLNIVNP